MWIVQVAAYAKINLFLDIVGVREDKYHYIHSVMQSVSLADDITIKTASTKGIKIIANRSDLPCDPTNTAFIAAELFCQYFDIKPELKIYIDKHIPTQSGLAGGSADAAAVLVGLNKLYGVDADIETLCKIGAEIGSDIPFCLTGGTAEATGTGEQIKLLPSLPTEECYIVIAKPSFGVSTKAAYKKYDSMGGVKPVPSKVEDMVTALANGNVQGVCENMYNVFEHVHFDEEYTEIFEVMTKCGAEGVSISGSGSACYGIFTNKLRAKRCYHKIKQVSGSVFLATPVPYGVKIM